MSWVATLQGWNEDSTVPTGCGQSIKQKLRAAAGVFVYTGFGMGLYYSASRQVLWCDAHHAREIAGNEQVPFVYLDGFDHAAEQAVLARSP